MFLVASGPFNNCGGGGGPPRQSYDPPPFVTPSCAQWQPLLEFLPKSSILDHAFLWGLGGKVGPKKGRLGEAEKLPTPMNSSCFGHTAEGAQAS